MLSLHEMFVHLEFGWTNYVLQTPMSDAIVQSKRHGGGVGGVCLSTKTKKCR